MILIQARWDIGNGLHLGGYDVAMRYLCANSYDSSFMRDLWILLALPTRAAVPELPRGGGRVFQQLSSGIGSTASIVVVHCMLGTAVTHEWYNRQTSYQGSF